MSQDLQVNVTSLTLAFSLVILSLALSYKEKLSLNKEIIIAVSRVIIQLVIMGFILTYIFGVGKAWVTIAMVAVMLLNAAWNAAKRGQGIRNAFGIALLSIVLASTTTLLILIFSGSLKFVPSQVIPITGMIGGQTMMSIGLIFRNLKQLFRDRKQQVQEMLALGANPHQASNSIKRLSIQAALQPTLDSIKTTGLVTLPGTMSGLIFAGVDPSKAILYQIMISFMIIGTNTLAASLAASLAVPSFFNDRYQIVPIKE